MLNGSSRWDIKVTEKRLAEFEIRLAAEQSRLAAAKANEAKSLSDDVAQLQLKADATGAHDEIDGDTSSNAVMFAHWNYDTHTKRVGWVELGVVPRSG